MMWYVKDDSKLGMLDTDQKYRLEHTLQRTAVSRKLLAFQVNMIRFIIITSDLINILCTCCFICFYFNSHGLKDILFSVRHKKDRSITVLLIIFNHYFKRTFNQV